MALLDPFRPVECSRLKSDAVLGREGVSPNRRAVSENVNIRLKFVDIRTREIPIKWGVGSDTNNDAKGTLIGLLYDL